MSTTNRFAFIVEVDNPGVTEAEMRAYVEDAVSTMKGCYDPQENIFQIDGDSVTVRNYRRVHPDTPIKVEPCRSWVEGL